MSPRILLLLAWPAIGLWFVASSKSRGIVADLIFVFSWPVHFILHLLGKE